MKKIVSVQDISCYGQCSLTVALPILSAYGIETVILPSALLSTHTTGFSDFTVLDLTDEMPKIIHHWKTEGIVFDAIYTGYIGDARQFELITGMRSMLREGGRLFVDPAMADRGELYPGLGEDIVAGMRRLVSMADVILPNLTEAAFLLDEPYKEAYSREEIECVARKLAAMGPDMVIITGVSYDEAHIGALAYDKKADSFAEYLTERVGNSKHGTGDVFSSVAIAHLLNGQTTEAVLENACEFVADAIKATLPYPDHHYGVRFEAVLAKRTSCKMP